MNIEGNQIGIRRYCSNDSVAFHEAIIESVSHMQEFMPWCHSHYSIAESDSWVESRGVLWEQKEEYSFVIYSLKNNELVGGVDINQLNVNHKIGNIGYWVRSQYLNKGIATEAVKLITGFGFNALRLNRLEIVMLPNNLASMRVAEKAGATFDGLLKKRLVVNDESLDACLYSIVNGV